MVLFNLKLFPNTKNKFILNPLIYLLPEIEHLIKSFNCIGYVQISSTAI